MSKNKTVRNVFFTIFCFFACVSLGYAESCSSKGQVQYKYTASGCSYTTQTRTCCSNGSWSDWDKSCPTVKTCDSASKPNSVEDYKDCCTRSRTVTCNTSTGLWETGTWSSGVVAYRLHSICCSGESGYTQCKASCTWNSIFACLGTANDYLNCTDQFVKESLSLPRD